MLRILAHLYYLYYGSQPEVDEMVHDYEKWGTPTRELTLLPCPLGFTLHNSQQSCVCHTHMVLHVTLVIKRFTEFLCG